MAIIDVTPSIDITALIASDNVNEGDVLLLEEGIYFQTVNILKNNIRIVAKGSGVIFDGRSTLLTAFTLSDVVGVGIEGINIRHYRLDGIVVQSGSGNRIVNNKINNILNNGIDILGSNGNLIWKNEICNCFDGIRLTSGSTNNWIIDNIVKECYDDGFESDLAPDSNNAFISNMAIRNRLYGFNILGSNNLVLDNLLIDNGLGVIVNEGSDSLIIGNIIRGSKLNALNVFVGYTNHFAGGNHIVCNHREGINNLGNLGMFLDNEISYNANSGITIGLSTNFGNLVKDNTLVCNIPENIIDRGTNNNFINNIDKPCEPCKSPGDICNACPDEADNSIGESKEGVNKCMQERK